MMFMCNLVYACKILCDTLRSPHWWTTEKSRDKRETIIGQQENSNIKYIHIKKIFILNCSIKKFLI